MHSHSECRELTEDERRDFSHRMDVVGAIVAGVQSLLSKRAPLADGVRENSGRLRSKWAIGLAAVAFVTRWLGEGSPTPGWLYTAGTTVLLVLAVAWFLPALTEVLMFERKLERVDTLLWEMRYRWMANGGFAERFEQLKALHKPDTGIDLDSDEYRAWWRNVHAEVLEKAMLVD